QKLLVHRDVLQQPRVVNFIEASPDVSFQYPLGGNQPGEDIAALFQGIGTPAAFAKAIGVSVCQSFNYGSECQRVERLHGAVVQGGNAQGTQFAVGLGDVVSAQRFRFVSVTFEIKGSLEFL